MAAALNKRNTETKFVSLFADSRADVDITFKDPVLSRSTSHYIVGVDNLTVSSVALSMIEPVEGEPLIRIFQKHLETHATLDGTLADFNTKIASAQSVALVDIDGAFTVEIDSTEVINNVQHLMERLSYMSAAVNTKMNAGLAVVQQEFNGYVPNAGEDTEHLQFSLSRSGKLVIEGTQAFWSLFCVEIPSTRNQFGVLGSKKTNVGQYEKLSRRRVLTVDPEHQEHGISFSNVVRYKTEAMPEAKYLFVTTITQPGDNTVLGLGTNNMRTGTHGHSQLKIRLELDGNLLQMDRRISVELGTSLPIKNSPMIDHQKEHPDFVIGRWMFRSPSTYSTRQDGSDAHYSTNNSCVIEYQNATDRVVYHELMPQNKLQVLRVKLFARVRTFDEKTEEFKNRTVDLPTATTDWWHCRLHFVTKD